MGWGLLDLKPGGGFRAWFHDIRGTHLIPDDEFLQALHPALRKGLKPFRLRDPVDVQTKLTLDAPPELGRPLQIWWDGGAVLQNAVVQAGVEISQVDGRVSCYGHHNGQQFEGVRGGVLLKRATLLRQPLRNVQARLEVRPDSPDVLRLHDLKADLFGGTLCGQARFQFGSPLRYEVLLEALGVRLEQFGQHNIGAGAQLQGPVRAAVHLLGEGDDLSGLRGNGQLDVPHGKMYRLPLLLGLLKTVGLRIPDHTAFDQAFMRFALEGPRLRVQHLDLIGNAISLRGQGTLNVVDGSDLNLDFNVDWGRFPQLLPPGVSDLSQVLSNQLLKIKMRGRIGAARFEKEFMPGIVEPLKKVFVNSP